ncbi:Dopey N-terminal domain-containing protein [Entamoeba marina]
MHAQIEKYLNSLLKSIQLIPFQQQIITTFNNRDLIYLQHIANIIISFSSTFTEMEFYLTLLAMPSIQLLFDNNVLLQKDMKLLSLPNHYSKTYLNYDENVFIRYVKALLSICKTILNEYQKETFDNEKYYLLELLKLFDIPNDKFNCIKDEMYSTVLLIALNNDEEIHSILLEKAQDILRIKKSNTNNDNVEIFFLQLFLDILKSSEIKQKRYIIDILITSLESLRPKLIQYPTKFFELIHCCVNNEVVTHAFLFLKELCKSILQMDIHINYIKELFTIIHNYVIQNVDINISLSAIQLQWDLLDIITQSTNISTETQSILTMQLFNQLLNEISDSRYDIWFSSVHTLLRSINDQGMLLSGDIWITIVKDILFSIFNTLRNKVYTSLFNTKKHPSKKQIQTVKVISCITPEVRRWNECITTGLSCVMRLQNGLFDKITNNELRIIIYQNILMFTYQAFYKPTINGVEVAIKYVFNILPLLFNKNIFDSLNQDLINETIQVISNINEFVISNNGLTSGTTVMFLEKIEEGLEYDNVYIHQELLKMNQKYICVFPDDSFINEHDGSLVQQKHIELIQKSIHSKFFEESKQVLLQVILSDIGDLSIIETIKERAEPSKWWGIPVLTKLLQNFSFDNDLSIILKQIHHLLFSLNILDSLIEDSQQIDSTSSLQISITRFIKLYSIFMDSLITIFKKEQSLTQQIVTFIQIISLNSFNDIPQQLMSQINDNFYESICLLYNTIISLSKNTYNDEYLIQLLTDVIGNNLPFLKYGTTLSKYCYNELISQLIDDIISFYNLNCNKLSEEHEIISELIFISSTIFPKLLNSKFSTIQDMSLKWMYDCCVLLVTSQHKSIRDNIQLILKQFASIFFN